MEMFGTNVLSIVQRLSLNYCVSWCLCFSSVLCVLYVAIPELGQCKMNLCTNVYYLARGRVVFSTNHRHRPGVLMSR